MTLLLLLAISLSFSSANNSESPFITIPIIEAPGDTIPGWEKQIIELYQDTEGIPLPVVFRGAAKNWGAASWTPEYFSNHFGNEEIVVLPQNLLEERLEYFEKEEETASKKNLVCPEGEKISICDEDQPCYEICVICDEKGNCHEVDLDLKPNTKKTIIDTTIKDHISDITFNPKNAAYLMGLLNHNFTGDEFSENPLFKNAIFIHHLLKLPTKTQFPQLETTNPVERKRTFILFIGGENTVTKLHNHGSTFLSQIYGKKIARLVNPQHIEKCSCKPDNEGNQYCNIDIAAPDFVKNPGLRDIVVYEAILEPGDVLYIPEKCLHDIRGLKGPTITISSGF